MADTFAMSFREPNGDWFYIPTVPEKRKWRGPYPTQVHMERACCAELGEDVMIHRTAVNGPNKHAKGRLDP